MVLKKHNEKKGFLPVLGDRRLKSDGCVSLPEVHLHKSTYLFFLEMVRV